MVLGHILGVVDLVGVHHGTDSERPQAAASPGGHRSDCARVGEHDSWHLELANPRPLVEPIPFRGALGLRTLPADVEAQILAEVS
jgi:hypothetical protein